MENHTFATTINCGSCVAAVTPHLDAAVGPGNWSVDTTDPRRVLTTPADITPEAVQTALAAAGHRIKEVLS